MIQNSKNQRSLKHGSVPFAQQRQRIHNQHKVLNDASIEEAIRAESPDGRPAHPAWKAKAMLVLICGSLLAVLAISAVTYALWGAEEALVVLALGVVFSIAGNPVIWAMLFRGKERELIHDVNGEDQDEREQTESITR